MASSLESIPNYLRKYCVEQSDSQYTDLEHASWRYIMRRAIPFFEEHAVAGYRKGLEKAGISTERIPSISRIDLALQEFGWGAVPVEGFIPPGAFLDFQARRILPVAKDMRQLANLSYTPAPDIVHEAAGHAPFLYVAAFSEYLMRYSHMAQRAIFSKEDLDLYAAIRNLSDMKEKPEATAQDIAKAQAGLEAAGAAFRYVSEAGQVARMNWWTVEYGLAGSLENPKIYGAGLLSSVGESKSLLGPRVKKIPLTVDCVHQAYDITEPQPQLYVAESIAHLVYVLEELEQTLAYRRGGMYGLEQAKLAHATTTTQLESGLQISGTMESYILGESGRPDFIRWQGPCQLSFGETELSGHGAEYHREGFSTPLGPWEGGFDASLEGADLSSRGILPGERAQLRFASGFQVAGRVRSILKEAGRALLITWEDCTVRRGEQVFFQPSWGTFDMAVGSRAASVFGGPADRSRYPEFGQGEATTTPGRETPYTQEEKKLFSYYREIRDMRQSSESGKKAEHMAEIILKNCPGHWLAALELYEIGKDEPWSSKLLSHLQTGGNWSEDEKELIENGLNLLQRPNEGGLAS